MGIVAIWSSDLNKYHISVLFYLMNTQYEIWV